jgi:excisionase family DNA binding protein
MSEETIVPRLLTVREVASLLRVHRPKVYDLLKWGDLEGFKLGADWRIKTVSVEKFIGQITTEMLCIKSQKKNS